MRNLLSLCAAVLLTTLSATASALGIAEPTLYSMLGQRLDCDMEIINAGELTTEELMVSVAAPAGLPSGISARVVKRSDGKTVVKLRSSEAINEPYLDFRVIVRWPQGELQREVTLLLDAPPAR